MHSKITTTLSLITSWIIRLFSYLIPRSKNVWICIGWHANKERELFADNSKYFFLYASKHYASAKVIWIARDQKLANMLTRAGYRAHSVHSLRGIYYSLRAKYTFVDAFMIRENWRYAGGTTLIQLWHGKGMKKTGHDSAYSLGGRSRFTEPNLFTRFDKLVASSSHTAKLMASTFRAPLEDILITGLPRNDVLFEHINGAEIDQNQALADAITKAKGLGARKLFLYAPTFRPDGSNPLNTINFPILNEALTTLNYHFLITLHPKFSAKDIRLDENLTNIHYVPAGFDSYPQLKHIDVLVTDYSSLYIDYLLLDRPIIFYTYDLETYKKEMGLHEDFDTLTPGPHPTTFTELIGAIRDNDRHTSERAHTRKVLFTHTDGNASKRLIQELFSQVD